MAPGWLLTSTHERVMSVHCARTFRSIEEFRDHPVIDLSWVLLTTTIPLDMIYTRFSAICRIVRGPHGDSRVRMQTIPDRRTGPGILATIERSRPVGENARADAFSQGGPLPRRLGTEEESLSPFLRQMLFQSAPPKLARPSSGEGQLYPIAERISPR
jgi:hypothetical protein